jgi:HAE1 family hydrophobic/amphiphilic exporter-1
MLSKFFISRPIFSSVISILIVLLGLVAYPTLPVEQYPELAPPNIRVEASYPGASAKVIAETVAAPLEQEVNGVDRMIYMNSTSMDNRYQLDVYFEVGADIDISSVLVQNRISVASAKLPEEVRRQGVTVRKQSSALIGVISLSSPDGTYDDLFLTNYININMKDELARVYGVGSAAIFPSKDYGMRVWLDPEKLKARDLTVTDVSMAIQRQNIQVAAGAIGRQPAPTGTDFEFVVNTLGRLTEPEQFAQIIVKTSPDGRIVRIADVGRVELGGEVLRVALAARLAERSVKRPEVELACSEVDIGNASPVELQREPVVRQVE